MSLGAPFPKQHRRKYFRTKNGCLSCRSCRKKCDGQRPVCGMCSRKSIDCRWPDLERIPGVENTDTERPRQASCAVQHCKTDQRVDQYSHQGLERNDLCCSSDGDTTSGNTSPSSSLRPGSMRDEKHSGLKNSSKAGLQCSAQFYESSKYRGYHCISSMVTIASPTANRLQLFNTFLSTFVPSNVLREEQEGSVYLMYFGFLEELARVDCSQPALVSAMGALSLVSVGSVTREPQMLHKSSEEYSKSVKLLAAAVRRLDSLHDESLLAAIMVLATCEFYKPFKQNSQAQGYYSHIHGLHSLLAARGPQPPKSRLTSLVLAKAKASSVSKSLVSHQRDFHEAPGWRELKLNVPSLDQDRSYDLAIRISHFFARSDQLDLDTLHSLQEIDELLRDGACLEHDMREDFDHSLHLASARIDPSITIEDIEHFPRFCNLVSDRTLSIAHRFQSYIIATRYTSYWLRLGILKTVVKHLQAKRRFLSSADLPKFADGFGKPVTEGELRCYVISVCRNLPFFAEPACGAAGDICSFFPLSWVGRYFAERKEAKWCAWVEDVREHLFVRGVSCPPLSWVKTREATEMASR